LIAADAAESMDVPADLEQRVREYLAENPAEPWEDAVRHAVEEALS